MGVLQVETPEKTTLFSDLRFNQIPDECLQIVFRFSESTVSVMAIGSEVLGRCVWGSKCTIISAESRGEFLFWIEFLEIIFSKSGLGFAV